MMKYTIAYDIAVDGFREWSTLYISLGLLALFGGLYFIQKRRRKSPIIAVAGIVFALLFLSIGVGMTYWDYNSLKNALERPHCPVVEGEISAYRTQTVTQRDRMRTTRTWESFTVGGVEFRYYREVSAAGFHNAAPSIISLRDGIKVKIHYLPELQIDEGRTENRILRLEIADL